MGQHWADHKGHSRDHEGLAALAPALQASLLAAASCSLTTQEGREQRRETFHPEWKLLGRGHRAVAEPLATCPSPAGVLCAVPGRALGQPSARDTLPRPAQLVGSPWRLMPGVLVHLYPSLKLLVTPKGLL